MYLSQDKKVEILKPKDLFENSCKTQESKKIYTKLA